jgi:Arc/MetJ-type ribon-helix-helix transcriptional regulator
VEIQLPEELERYVDDQVKAGRFTTKDQVVTEALERFKQATVPARPPLLGLFADEPELMDEVVEEAMRDRETRPLRLPADG